MEKTTVGIVGLGLMGASFARAYKKNAPDIMVLGANRTKSVCDRAIEDGVIDGELDDDNVCECDFIIVSLYPEASAEYIREHRGSFRKGALVIDCCGNKRMICKAGYEASAGEGFSFVGGHPMAGTQFSGYSNSKADMFLGASMILVPDPKLPDDVRDAQVFEAESLLAPAKFGSFVVTTPEKHDFMIAFTSQMAHVLASCYIKSPGAIDCKGFTGGSFGDMTRVAYLNPEMWTELFLANADNLTAEIEAIQGELEKVRTAIANGDAKELCRLLDEGRALKEVIKSE